MSTIPEIIRSGFTSKIQKDPELQAILKSIRNNGGDYKDAEKYANRAGQLLSAVLQEQITEKNFPVGSVSEIAGLLVPAMEVNYHAVTQVSSMVQKSLNSDGGIGMNSIIPAFNKSTAYNLAGRMAKYESFEDAKWILDEPIKTSSLTVADDTLRKNADFQYRSGMKPKIIRTCESDACEWCQELEGEYDYEEVKDRNNPVFQRHNNCQCEITYEPVDGRVQDVHSKQWYDSERATRRFEITQSLKKKYEIHDLQREKKLKYKLDFQFFGGKERAEKHEANWQKASLKETVTTLIPTEAVWTETNEKRVCRSNNSRYMIIFDKEGQYFRIMDLQSTEKGERKYVGLDGSNLNYYTDNEGNVQTISLRELRRLTHFKNTDFDD